VTALDSLIAALGAATGWTAVFIAAVIAVFVVYVGAAVGVSLFHPDPKVRRHAAGVLDRLLRFLARGRR
jgi:predicted tellurium resistance membrane protein TerC